jgi:PPK2 family polyphosphate:nucleotide phosphotransferase
MDITKACLVKPGSKVDLQDYDPGRTLGFKHKDEAAKHLEKNLERLFELQSVLSADKRYALLIILQAVDAGGKDGTISHVMRGVNPQGCQVTSFKAPTTEELAHDFLWRIHKAVPQRGMIGIFNRSHYEDVLVVRVHGMVPESVWSKRYAQINAFEESLAQNNVKILKFLLHISSKEQKERLEERIADPTKNWKISEDDFRERKHWKEYMRAYEDALSKCSTAAAPWFIIPANRKWVRNFAVSLIIVEALEAMKLKYPPPSIDLSKLKVK